MAFHRALAFAVVALSTWSMAVITSAASPPRDARPNILFAIADDWSWPHAGGYGDRVVKTPTFDRVAREGVLFSHSYCAAPSCSASRAAILTGQWPHRLESGADLWGTLPARFAVYPDVLEHAGYHVGFERKGWGPGALGDRKRNPAGRAYKNFEEFLKTAPADGPFCYWFGSHDPHRPYIRGSGKAAGMNPADVTVPPYLPDTPETRSDILDYYAAVQRYDRDTGHILDLLEQAGRFQNTIVVMTSDNGWPFPRAKANLYDYGTHMPLAIRWPAGAKGGRVVDAFVSHVDFAPTFLEAAGLPLSAMPDMSGRSLLSLLTGNAPSTTQPAAREPMAFVERERHANVRAGDLSYPSRAVRTERFLYVRNLRPDLWPAGDPQMWKAVGPFGDIDPGPTKDRLLSGLDHPEIAHLFDLACGRRPPEELYDLRADPDQLHNVAGQTEYAEAQRTLRASLDEWMRDTNDPRAAGGAAYDAFDRYPYFGDAKPMPASRKADAPEK